MSGENWQPGDLALCVNLHPSNRDKYGIHPGGVYLVERVIEWRGEVGIILDGHHSDHSTGALNPAPFRRIPPTEADRFDQEVIEALKSQPEPAEA